MPPTANPSQDNKTEEAELSNTPANLNNPSTENPVAESSPFTPTSPVAMPTVPTEFNNSRKGFSAWSKRKKALLAIGVAAVLALIGAGAAFAFYSAPQKVVGDAVMSSLFTETADITGEADIKFSGEQTGTSKVTYDITMNDQTFKADLGANVKVAPISMDIAGSVIGDAGGNYYFKINDAKQILTNIFGGGFSEGSEKLTSLIDNKWVKVDKSDIEASMSEEEKKEAECQQKLTREIPENRQLTNGIIEVYKQHAFIKTESLSSDSFSTLHYRLTLDEQKAKNFAKAFEQTELYKRLKACDKDFTVSEQEVSEVVGGVNKANIEVWINRWSHELRKVEASGKDEDVEYAATANTAFGEPVIIDVPKDATPWEDVMAELKSLFAGMFMDFNDSAELELTQEEQELQEEYLRQSAGEEPFVLGLRTNPLLQLFQ